MRDFMRMFLIGFFMFFQFSIFNSYGCEDFADCENKANQGNAEAQNHLGIMYVLGDEVTRDYKEAVKWFKKAAERGHAEGQNSLAKMYAFEMGVTRDYKEAVKWLRKAAEQGHAKAQQNLARMYALGRGVAKDYKEVAKWTRKAADQGLAKSQYILGRMYAEGTGVTQDYFMAHMFLNIASANGYSDAGTRRDAVAKKMTGDQIATAQKMAKEWMENH